ncbi:MAG TPA: hypothetical protein PK397_05145 [Ignavibacteriaceae bacterium]|nr:hypothetical protein [Ignavibacteriaceae bacterium]
MKKLFFLSLFILSLMVLFSSCKEDENPAGGDTENVKTLTMTHWGVDWSKGEVGSTSQFLTEPDGETIAWCEYGTTNNFWQEMIMYRPATGKMYKLTSADLAGLTTLDTTMFQTSFDCGVAKLKPGDVWVSECIDGYVAFKVVEAPQDSASIAADQNWSVKVQYKFSTTTKF